MLIYQSIISVFHYTALIFFFFFSSRRRHTRLVSDWSSDVCSSDLICSRMRFSNELEADHASGKTHARTNVIDHAHRGLFPRLGVALLDIRGERPRAAETKRDTRNEIGRASCRERV